MLESITANKIYIACGYTDLRRGIDGLASLVSEKFSLDPFSDSLFIFCGRRKDRIKLLLWDGDGFILMCKRLENSIFFWPRTPEEVKELSRQQYRWLLEGLSIDQPKAHKPLTDRHFLV